MATNEQLITAVRNNNFEKVKSIINSGINPKDGITTGGSMIDTNTITTELALPCATSLGYYDIAELLIRNGAQVDESDTPVPKNPRYPIVEAVKNGHIEIVKLLIRYGANYKVKDNDFKPLVEIAKNFNHQEIIELLDNIENHNTKMVDAVKSNNLEMVKEYHGKGASYNAKINGQKLFKYAKENNFEKIYEYFLSYGAGTKTKTGCLQGCLSYIWLIIVITIILLVLGLIGVLSK